MDNLLERFVSGAIVALIVSGTPLLIKLGKVQKQKCIQQGKIYYGLLWYRIFLLFILGIITAETILMCLIGDTISGSYALIVMLLLSLPFTAMFIIIYNKLFRKRNPLKESRTEERTPVSSIQYESKPASGSKIVDIIIMVLLVASLAVNIYLFLKNNEFMKTIQAVNQASAELESELTATNKAIGAQTQELKQCYDQLDMYNSIIVFVENDKTRLYHRYKCEKFIGDDFWAYNLEYAESKGYKPCELCHNSEKTSLGFVDEVNYLLMEGIVGEDHEISVAEIAKLNSLDYTNLISSGTVFVCKSWAGLYHNLSCERLEGICSTYLPQFAELEGFNPCPNCFK